MNEMVIGEDDRRIASEGGRRAAYASNEEPGEVVQQDDDGIQSDSEEPAGEQLSVVGSVVVVEEEQLVKQWEQDLNCLKTMDMSLKLTNEEKEWAIEIKRLVDQDPELEPMSDFMIAQAAIVTLNGDLLECNVRLAKERLANHQASLQQHNIRDTYADACKVLDRTFQQLVPGHYMFLNSNVMAVDLTNFDRAVSTTDSNKLDTYLAATYYLFHAQNSNFSEIRNGSTYLFECTGYDWHSPDMCNQHVVNKIGDLSYPILMRSRLYNTNMFVNLLVSWGRRFFPTYINENVKVGCRVGGGGGGGGGGYSSSSSVEDAGGRLDRMFLIPDVESANERFLEQIKELLRQRYENQSQFSLDSC